VLTMSFLTFYEGVVDFFFAAHGNPSPLIGGFANETTHKSGIPSISGGLCCEFPESVSCPTSFRLSGHEIAK
jgi:hypothetical protein